MQRRHGVGAWCGGMATCRKAKGGSGMWGGGGGGHGNMAHTLADHSGVTRMGAGTLTNAYPAGTVQQGGFVANTTESLHEHQPFANRKDTASHCKCLLGKHEGKGEEEGWFSQPLHTINYDCNLCNDGITSADSTMALLIMIQ